MSKKIISIFLVLSMLMSLCVFTVWADGDVLLSYSFENESEGWSYFRPGNAINSLSESKAKDGKKSLYINDTEDALSGGFQSPMFEVITGETYTATIDVNQVSAGTYFYLRFSDADKKKLADKQTKATKTGEWETLTASMAAPEGAVYVHILAVTFNKTFGEAYYDNAKLVGKTKTPVETKEDSSKKDETTIVVEDGVKFKTEIEFLSTIGLIDSSLDLKANVTKAQMAKMIAKAMHPEVDFENASAGVQVFNDVPTSHKYYSYIKACKDIGIVKGDFSNNFNPDNQVTAIEAMTMVINALGYTPYAEAFGGYPTGYFQVASQTGISKGVNVSSSELVTGEVVAKIIYNALFADLVQMGSISNNQIEIEVNNGKNILSERLGIYEYDALIVDNGIGAIEGLTMGDTEKAVIKESSTGKTITAYSNGTRVNEYLGYRVKAFIRNNIETGRNEFVYVAPSAKYETVTLSAKYIFNVTSDYIEYDEDDTTADYEKYNLGGSTPIIVVNGVRITSINNQTTEPLLKQVMAKDGIVTLIDNTGDSIFDVINILSFNYANGSYTGNARNIVVDSIDTTEDEHAISCGYNPANSLGLGEDEAGYQFAVNESVNTIKDVKEGMIISVAECPQTVDGKPYYFLVAHEEKIDSELSGTSGNIVILANGAEYELSTSLKANFINYLSMGKKVTVCLDVTGKAAFVENESGYAKNYAYIIKAVKRPYAGSEAVIVKLLTKEGKIEELRLASKCKIDGEWYSDAALQEKAINERSNAGVKMTGDVTTGRPAIVNINSDGYISAVDTDNPNISLGYQAGSTYINASPDVKSDFYASQQPIPYSEEDEASYETLKAGFRNPRASAFYDNNVKSVEGKFFITANTFVINAAEIDTYANNVYSKYSAAYGNGKDKYHCPPSLSITQLQNYEGEEDEYSVSSGKDVARSKKYDIQGYDIDPETGVAGLAVIRGKISDTISSSAELLIYSRRTAVYDVKAEKTVSKLYYYGKDGKEKSVLYDPDRVLNETSDLVDKKLEVGDIFALVADSDGYVSTVIRLMNVKKLADGTAYTSPDLIEEGVTDITASYYMAYSNNTSLVGYANKVNGGVAEMVGAGIGSTLNDLKSSLSSIKENNRFFIDFSNVEPIIVTLNGSELRVEKGTLNDIVTVKEATDINGSVNVNKPSVILYRQSRFIPNYMIVFNGLDTYGK